MEYIYNLIIYLDIPISLTLKKKIFVKGKEYEVIYP